MIKQLVFLVLLLFAFSTLALSYGTNNFIYNYNTNTILYLSFGSISIVCLFTTICYMNFYDMNSQSLNQLIFSTPGIEVIYTEYVECSLNTIFSLDTVILSKPVYGLIILNDSTYGCLKLDVYYLSLSVHPGEYFTSVSDYNNTLFYMEKGEQFFITILKEPLYICLVCFKPYLILPSSYYPITNCNTTLTCNLLLDLPSLNFVVSVFSKYYTLCTITNKDYTNDMGLLFLSAFNNSLMVVDYNIPGTVNNIVVYDGETVIPYYGFVKVCIGTYKTSFMLPYTVQSSTPSNSTSCSFSKFTSLSVSLIMVAFGLLLLEIFYPFILTELKVKSFFSNFPLVLNLIPYMVSISLFLVSLSNFVNGVCYILKRFGFMSPPFMSLISLTTSQLYIILIGIAILISSGIILPLLNIKYSSLLNSISIVVSNIIMIYFEFFVSEFNILIFSFFFSFFVTLGLVLLLLFVTVEFIYDLLTKSSIRIGIMVFGVSSFYLFFITNLVIPNLPTLGSMFVFPFIFLFPLSQISPYLINFNFLFSMSFISALLFFIYSVTEIIIIYMSKIIQNIEL